MATPCWPAPVSAMMRSLPSLRASEDLAERVVDLVRAGVREVLALQPDVVAELVGQPRGMGDRRRAPDEVRQEPTEFGLERGIVAELTTTLAELLQRRDQDLRRVPPAERPEAPRLRTSGTAATLMPIAPPCRAAPGAVAAGSPARISASPTRMADAPAATAPSTSARVRDAAFEHRDPVPGSAAIRMRAAGRRRPRASPGRARSRPRSARPSRAPGPGPRPSASRRAAPSRGRAPPRSSARSSSSSRQAAISRTASAPAARAASTWSASIRKSLRSNRDVDDVSDRRRSSSDPPKWHRLGEHRDRGRAGGCVAACLGGRVGVGRRSRRPTATRASPRRSGRRHRFGPRR